MELRHVCVNLRVFRLADNYRSQWKSKKKIAKSKVSKPENEREIYVALTGFGSIDIKMNKAITRTGRGRWKRAYPALKLISHLFLEETKLVVQLVWRITQNGI